jgi:hypothetical protein
VNVAYAALTAGFVLLAAALVALLLGAVQGPVYPGDAAGPDYALPAVVFAAAALVAFALALYGFLS